MHWVLQDNICSEEGFTRLTTALERLGLSYSVHKVIPFVGEITDAERIPEGKVITMGSYSMARQAVKRGWVPGAYLDNLDFEIQRDKWGELMFNHDAHICRFEDVPFQKEPFFIRPVHDTKAFTGMVVDWGYYENWRDGLIRVPEVLDPVNDPLGANLMTVNTPVMVCKKKEIYRETRCWVVGGKIVTASAYKIGTRKIYAEVPGTPFTEPVLAFADSCASIWSPNRAYVLDVFMTPEGFRIGEVNNLNSAGFYDGDMGKLAMALEELEA